MPTTKARAAQAAQALLKLEAKRAQIIEICEQIGKLVEKTVDLQLPPKSILGMWVGNAIGIGQVFGLSKEQFHECIDENWEDIQTARVVTNNVGDALDLAIAKAWAEQKGPSSND